MTRFLWHPYHLGQPVYHGLQVVSDTIEPRGAVLGLTFSRLGMMTSDTIERPATAPAEGLLFAFFERPLLDFLRLADSSVVSSRVTEPPLPPL